MSKNFLVDINLNKFQLLNAVIQVLTTAPASPTTGQIYYSSTDQTFYGFNGTSWLNLGNQGAGECNLSFSADATTVTVISSTGTDATLTSATTSAAGVMSAADKTKLDGIETGATADQLAADVPFNNTSSGLTATNVQTAIDEIKTYADNLIIGGFVNKGGYDASTNSPNLDSTPIGGIKNGWTYIVTVAGDFFSESVQVGDMITAKQDSPTLLTHWTIVNKNIPDIVMASETDSGLVEEATSAELTSGASTGGSGAKLFITPAKLNTYLGITGGLTSTVKYTTAIGDGTNTTITVTHNIGKQFNNTQIYQTGSPYAQVECDIECLSTTQTRFKFNVAPTTNQYTVVIIG